MHSLSILDDNVRARLGFETRITYDPQQSESYCKTINIRSDDRKLIECRNIRHEPEKSSGNLK